MNFKLLVLSLILLSVIFALPQTSRGISSQSLGAGKMTYVIATTAGGPGTVDPALAYDTASGELIQNVYDTLVFLNGTSADQIVPWLASSYSISPDGLTYSFIIRAGVQWQDPAYGVVTPVDVEYSLKKVLVRDYAGGPAWMFWFSIFGFYSATDYGNLSDPAVATALGSLIDSAITSNATGVTIHFETGKAYPPFLGILVNTWGSIQSKQWCINNGDWNPAVSKLNDGTWVNARNPATSPLDIPFKMMGSGPFEFNYLNAAVAWGIIRNGGQDGSIPGTVADPHPTTTFWGGWGTSRTSLLGFSGVTSRGYVDEIVQYFISEYATRFAGFTGPAPIYDSIAVPTSQMSTVWQQPGIRCIYPLPTLRLDAIFFNYNISASSPFIGNGQWGENDIIPTFFSDIHVRRAIAYSLNWTQVIASTYLGEAQQVPVPLPTQLPFYNGSLPKFGMNATRAVEEWKLAWGGNSTSPGLAWTQGFSFDVLYYPTNVEKLAWLQNLKTNVEAQNPKFHINVFTYYSYPYGKSPPRDWGPSSPMFAMGWLADYADVDDWVTPFIRSSGIFGSVQHISLDPYSGLMDSLITWGAHNTTFEGRNANYQQLWNMYIQQVPSIPLVQPLGRRWARDWIHGWYYNPIFPGVYGYSLWKEVLPWEDVNEDGKVDIRDLATGAKAFGAYFIQPLLPPNPQGPPGTYSSNWNSKADLNMIDSEGGRGDMKIDIRDLAQMAKLYGFIPPAWQPRP